MNSYMLVALGKEEVVHVWGEGVGWGWECGVGCVGGGGGSEAEAGERNVRKGVSGGGTLRNKTNKQKTLKSLPGKNNPNSKFYLERYTAQNST